MLRSLDTMSAQRWPASQTRNGGRSNSRVSTSTDGWAARGIASSTHYRAGLRNAGVPILVDPALIRAFEIEKECYEFIYAATYLPSWLWAPTEGMRGLFA